MQTFSKWVSVSALLVTLATVLPSPALAQSGRPAQTEPRQASEADVRFIQRMIPHHAQALDMTALVPGRTESRSLRLIAERIEVSQRDEIAWMTRWLQDHDAEVPAPDAHVGHGVHHDHSAGHHALMPGMLAPEEMARLASASDAAFDRLFLESMIRHHEGALVMVAELLAAPGAAQAPEVYRFASDVEADQRAEIARMRALLDAPTHPTSHDH
jgi:uncharacterized protein (DUF305 family)